MALHLWNISIEGIEMSKIYKKKTELFSLTADYKRLDAEGDDYKFHGITVERLAAPNFVARTFDGSGNVLSGATVTFSGVTLGTTNQSGYLYHELTGSNTNAVISATKSSYTSDTSKVSNEKSTTLFHSFYLAVVASTAVVDKAIFRIANQKIVKRSTDQGVRSFTKVSRSNLVTASNFSTSNVTEQQLYDHFVALTSGSPVADKVILIPVAGRYKYVRRYEQGGVKKYQAVLRSSLATSGNFNSSSHTPQEIFDFMVEYLTGTNP